MSAWLAVVGLGEDGMEGLGAAARALIDAAELLVGGERHLALVPTPKAVRLPWKQPLSETVAQILEHRGRPVVVLASGDPLHYGVATLLARQLKPAEMIVLPQASAFSLAAARLLWPLEECVCLSLHARPVEKLRLHLAPGARIIALSTYGDTPVQVAELLRSEGWGASAITVFARMGGARERRVEGTAEAWPLGRIAALNTIAIECRSGARSRPRSRLAGLADDAFENDGQITKRVVRAATLAALAPLPGELLWDIGAGCGSVAIEWLRAERGMAAIAVERDAMRTAMIQRNAAKLGVPELRIVHGSAPAVLRDLPLPDAIFVGGGVSDNALFEALWRALKPGGRLVANAVTVEGEVQLARWQSRAGGQLSRLSVAQAEPIGSYQGWRPLMTVTQLATAKAKDAGS